MQYWKYFDIAHNVKDVCLQRGVKPKKNEIVLFNEKCVDIVYNANKDVKMKLALMSSYLWGLSDWLTAFIHRREDPFNMSWNLKNYARVNHASAKLS